MGISPVKNRHQDIPAHYINTSRQLMAWIVNVYSMRRFITFAGSACSHKINIPATAQVGKFGNLGCHADRHVSDEGYFAKNYKWCRHSSQRWRGLRILFRSDSKCSSAFTDRKRYQRVHQIKKRAFQGGCTVTIRGKVCICTAAHIRHSARGVSEKAARDVFVAMA